MREKIGVGVSCAAIFGVAYEFGTLSLLDGLNGPVGGGGILIIAGIYLALGIVALSGAIYLASVSKIARYALGIFFAGALSFALIKGSLNQHENRKFDYSQEVINIGKLCPEVRYSCLSETQDETWLDVDFSSETTLNSNSLAYAEVAEMVEVIYPGFWQETAQDDRLNWVMQVERIGNKYQRFKFTTRSLVTMAAICAVIGTDFENKPEHAPTVNFLTILAEDGNGSVEEVLDFILFAHLERDYDTSGKHYNSWTRRGRFKTFVEPPKRPTPHFDDVLETDHYRESHDAWKVFKTTIEAGGRSQN